MKIVNSVGERVNLSLVAALVTVGITAHSLAVLAGSSTPTDIPVTGRTCAVGVEAAH